MKNKLIEALADVLDIDLSAYSNLTQDQILAMLEDQQAQELVTV